MDVVFVYLLVARQTSAVLTVDHRRLLDADRMDGRGGLDVGKRDFHRVLDGMEELDDDVGDVAERQFAALVPSRTSGSARLSDGAPHLQRVKQERLQVACCVVRSMSKARKTRRKGGGGGGGFRWVKKGS